jgi:hypothetical protein
MRHLPILCAALLLAGCSTAGLIDTPQPKRGLDYGRDDLASLRIAFDLPRGVAPIEGASALTYAGDRPLRVGLVPADMDDVAGSVPPPGTGRAYYVYGIAPADQQPLREAQRNAGSGAALTAVPRLCRSGAVDPKRVSVTVYAVVPGAGRLAPLIERQVLADLLAASGISELPAC